MASSPSSVRCASTTRADCSDTSRDDAPSRTNAAIAHPAVARVTFTGSDRVARFIAQECGKHLKQAVFELGGKNTVVVCADADLEAAAKAIVSASMLHGGQVRHSSLGRLTLQICMGTDRVLAERSIADKLSDLIATHARHLAGDAIPPLFTEQSAQRVLDNIVEAKDTPGVTLLTGDATRNGAHLGAHVLRGVKAGVKLWHEESFGPVVSLLEFETVDEAIALANDSEYAFVAAVWTSNLQAGHRIASGIRVGQVVVNGSSESGRASILLTMPSHSHRERRLADGPVRLPIWLRPVRRRCFHRCPRHRLHAACLVLPARSLASHCPIVQLDPLCGERSSKSQPVAAQVAQLADPHAS